MKKESNYLVKIVGIYFIILGIFSIGYSIYSNHPDQILWLCYISLIIFGIGAIKEDSSLIISQMAILTLPLLVWNVDFFYQLFTGKPLMGITSYFFSSSHPIVAKFVSLQHVYTLPFAFYIINKLKHRLDFKHILKIAYAQMLAVFILGRLFTDPSSNINCIFRNCMPFDTVVPYEVAWIFAVAIGILLTTKFLKFIFKKSYKLT